MGGVLINEVNINPPGGADETHQFVEILTVNDASGQPESQTIGDIQLVLVDSSGGKVGKVEDVVDLEGLVTGANGLLLIGKSFDSPRGGPFSDQLEADTAVADWDDLVLSNGRGDLGPKSGLTLLLVRNNRAAFDRELDGDDDGSIDVRPWDAIIDSVGWGDEPYVTKLRPAFTPEHVGRIAGNVTVNSVAAWYGGGLENTTGLTSLTYNEDFFPDFAGRSTPGAANVSRSTGDEIVINEVVIDPAPGGSETDTFYENIELATRDGTVASTTDLWLLIIATRSSDDVPRGQVLEAWDLSGANSTGSNGLLLLGNDYPDYTPWGDLPNDTALFDPAGTAEENRLSPGDIRSNTAYSILLVKDYDNTTKNIDTNDDGVIDSPRPWDTGLGTEGIIDSVGASELNANSTAVVEGGRTYALVDLSQPGEVIAVGGVEIETGYQPDMVARFGGAVTANNKDDWFGGHIGGESQSGVLLEKSRSFGPFQGYATPGLPNPATSESDAVFVLNEVHIDPPAEDDGNFEFIEILSLDPTGLPLGLASLVDVRLLIVPTSGADAGKVRDVWDLGSLSTGVNGLLLLGDEYTGASLPYGSAVHQDTHPEDPPGVNIGDIKPNSGVAILLVKGFTGAVDDDLDTDNDGVYDSKPWATLYDSVAFGDTISDNTLGVINAGFTPDTLARLPGNARTNSAEAWVAGEVGTGDPLRYTSFTGSFRGAVTPGRYNMAAAADDSGFLLNEVHINPPGADENFEFVEIIHTGLKARSTNNLYLLRLDAKGGGKGRIREAWNLDGLATGSNGLLLLGDEYGRSPSTQPFADLIGNATVLADPEGLGSEDIGPGDSFSLLLVRGFTGQVAIDVDSDDTPPLDTQNLPWTELIDSVAIRDTSDGDTVVYSDADLSQTSYQPDSISRVAGNVTPNSAVAWYGGDLLGAAQSGVKFDPASRFTAGLEASEIEVTPGQHNAGGGFGDADDDGDGASNASEGVAGTDPNDPTDYLRITGATETETGVLLRWTAKPGKSYVVEFSETMRSDDWQTLATVEGEADAILEHEAVIMDRKLRLTVFYRIRVPTQ